MAEKPKADPAMVEYLAGKSTSAATRDAMMARLEKVAPALLEVQIRAVLQDHTLDRGEASARAAKLLDRLAAMREERRAEIAAAEDRTASLDRVPQNDEEARLMELEADRLRQIRITSYKDREVEAERLKQEALRAADADAGDADDSDDADG